MKILIILLLNFHLVAQLYTHANICKPCAVLLWLVWTKNLSNMNIFINSKNCTSTIELIKSTKQVELITLEQCAEI
jgi:hypothetical protein